MILTLRYGTPKDIVRLALLYRISNIRSDLTLTPRRTLTSTITNCILSLRFSPENSITFQPIKKKMTALTAPVMQTLRWAIFVGNFLTWLIRARVIA